MRDLDEGEKFVVWIVSFAIFGIVVGLISCSLRHHKLIVPVEETKTFRDMKSSLTEAALEEKAKREKLSSWIYRLLSEHKRLIDFE